MTGTAGLALLVYAIVSTDTHPWGSGRTLILLAIAVALLVTFVVLQARVVKAPLMPLSLFRSRSLTAANATMVLTGAAFFSMWYFLTLYLQDVHGYGPLKAGLLFVPMGIFIIIGAQVGSRLVNQIGPGPVVMIGLALTTGGFIWLGQLDASSTYLAGVLPGSFLTTVGVGLSFPSLAAAATTGVPLFQTGLASGRPQHVAPGGRFPRPGGPGDRRNRPDEPRPRGYLARPGPDRWVRPGVPRGCRRDGSRLRVRRRHPAALTRPDPRPGRGDRRVRRIGRDDRLTPDG